MALKEKLFVLAAILCVGFTAQTLVAQDKGVETSRELFFQAASEPGAKLGFTQNFRFPFLQGESPLTEGNNINLALTAEISPISLNGLVNAVWTPIAFLEFSVGGRIGSGWNIELFGSNVYGIGINRAGDGSGAGSGAETDGSAFDGVLWKLNAGGTFQFDLAAIFPGDWNHVVFRTYHEINYNAYTRAKAGESWYFENDFGENVNGFNYYGNYLVGYQMPIFLNMAAFLAETYLYLYDTPNRDAWGDERTRWSFAGVFNFAVMKQLDITLLVQFRTMRNYVQSNWEDLYYRERTINTSNPIRLEFYRVVAVFTYKF